MSSRWELPAQTEVEHDAPEVLFPWSQAQSALDQLDDLLDRLAAYENVDRHGLVGSLGAWEGPYRTEFDDAESGYLTDLGDLRSALAAMGDNIVDLADEANLEQEALNDEAFDEQQAEQDGGDDSGGGG